MSRILSFAAVLLVLAFSSCTYSKFPLDESPKVKADESLYGIWKIENNTNDADFVLLQSIYDVRKRDPKKYTTVEEWMAAAPTWTGVDEAYLAREREDFENREYTYHITYFDREGKNPHYQQFGAFLSQVGRSRFLNVDYWHEADHGREVGYLLYKIVNVNASCTKVTLALVYDESLEKAKDAQEVREKVTANLDNKHYYNDTVVLYCVKPGHFSLSESVKLANN